MFKKKTYAILWCAVLCMSCQLQGQQDSALDPKVIAKEAYVYLYPLVLMDITRKQMTNVEQWNPKTGETPLNTIGNFQEYPPLDFKTVVRPNFDTLYSIGWIDLRKEPMILTVPSSNGRYYLMQTLDMWTDTFASPGWRTTGTEAAHFAYCPPGWQGKLPEGVVRIDAPTPIVWMIGRTETRGPKDYDAVHQFQNGLKLVPLSYWSKEWTAPRGKIDSSVDMKTPPMLQVRNMSGKDFFAYGAELMKVHPPHEIDFSQIARMAHIGLIPGKDLNFSGLSSEIQEALNNAPMEGQKTLDHHMAIMGKMVNGWKMLLTEVGVYGIAYDQRGAIAMAGLGANQLPDAVYPQALNAPDGKPFNGSANYKIHFDKGQTPPADAFWSITLYDKDGYPVPNALNRANLSSWMPLQYNSDGSLDLFFQNDSPGKDKENNWLPTPKEDGWNLTLRIYAPQNAVFNGSWNPAEIQ